MKKTIEERMREKQKIVLIPLRKEYPSGWVKKKQKYVVYVIYQKEDKLNKPLI